MAEHLYTTRAFILGRSELGEADCLLDLLTESHGRLRGLARGARREASKLRYHLEPMRFAEVSLVRGRELWRLVGAVGEDDPPLLTPAARRAIRGSILLLKRLLQGEEAAPALFSAFHDGCSFLAREPLSGEELKNAECVLVLRILFELGYLGREEPVAPFLNGALSRELLQSVSPVRRAAVAAINRSLHASSL